MAVCTYTLNAYNNNIISYPFIRLKIVAIIAATQRESGSIAGNNADRHFAHCASLYNIIKIVSKQWFHPQQEHGERKKTKIHSKRWKAAKEVIERVGMVALLETIGFEVKRMKISFNQQTRASRKGLIN